MQNQRLKPIEEKLRRQRSLVLYGIGQRFYTTPVGGEKRIANFFVKYLDGKANDGYHNVKTGFRSYFVSFDDGAKIGNNE